MGKKRITMADVAKRAGVGIATIDRVLNRRAPVRTATAERVVMAANELGYHNNRLLMQRVEEISPVRELGFILQKQGKSFYQQLARELILATDSLMGIRAKPKIAYVESLSPEDLAKVVEELAETSHSLALVSIDHPIVSAAVEKAEQNGRKVFSMLSPLSCASISGHIGIESRKAGRTAGWLMALHVESGPVGILVGSHRYLGHEALEIGFRSYMREHAPNVGIRESLVYLDDAAVAYEATSELLKRIPEIRGIFHCGGGVAGVLKALNESGQAGNIAYICQDTGPATRKGLLEGAVSATISTPVSEVAGVTASAMEKILVTGKRNVIPPLQFQIITPENI